MVSVMAGGRLGLFDIWHREAILLTCRYIDMLTDSWDRQMLMMARRAKRTLLPSEPRQEVLVQIMRREYGCGLLYSLI